MTIEQRVSWECRTPACSVQTHHGRIWRPSVDQSATRPVGCGNSHHAIATALGLTRDEVPFRCRRDGTEPVMVAFDDAPGALSAHHRDELTYPPTTVTVTAPDGTETIWNSPNTAVTTYATTTDLRAPLSNTLMRIVAIAEKRNMEIGELSREAEHSDCTAALEQIIALVAAAPLLPEHVDRLALGTKPLAEDGW